MWQKSIIKMIYKHKKHYQEEDAVKFTISSIANFQANKINVEKGKLVASSDLSCKQFIKTKTFN